MSAMCIAATVIFGLNQLIQSLIHALGTESLALTAAKKILREN